MIIAVPKENCAGERRVALVPETVQRLVAKGILIRVESGAGSGGWFTDEDYCRAGASIEPSAETLFRQAEVIIKIRPPAAESVELLRQGAALVCLLYPRCNSDVTVRLAARNITAIALENLPRITVAQAMDVLSSQSTAAGYRAVIVAAYALTKFFPMLMTPAGTVAPTRVLVLGAGVAGLQAIATARRLGAVVEAFDVRPAAREEVESLGARFIAAETAENFETAEGYARPLPEETQQRARAVIQRSLVHADVCITTALVPNQRAPLLLTADMVRGMRPGSVVVDLAAEQGGNCELTEPGKEVIAGGVTIIGSLNLASGVAADASRMYSRNVEQLLRHFLPDGVLRIDFRDEITRRCVVTHGGQIVQEDLRALGAANGGTNHG